MYDLFISHANEDKDAIALPLFHKLQELGLQVWIDKMEMKAGDNLTQSIETGLNNARYGVVIISPNFLKKKWTALELRRLAEREVRGSKVIIPVWYNVDENEIRNHSDELADRLGISTKGGLQYIVDEILKFIHKRSGGMSQDIVVAEMRRLLSLTNDFIKNFMKQDSFSVPQERFWSGERTQGSDFDKVVEHIAMITDRLIPMFGESSKFIESLNIIKLNLINGCIKIATQVIRSPIPFVDGSFDPDQVWNKKILAFVQTVPPSGLNRMKIACESYLIKFMNAINDHMQSLT